MRKIFFQIASRKIDMILSERCEKIIQLFVNQFTYIIKIIDLSYKLYEYLLQNFIFPYF